MKKFEIETTVNGGAVVTQRHTVGTDNCETSYGDKWVFLNTTLAGQWVDSQISKSSVLSVEQYLPPVFEE